jgi:hypothetical protein
LNAVCATAKDLRFGLGLAKMHVKSPSSVLNAFAVMLLALLGAAGGYDRMLKTNSAKRWVHSLFRRGCMLSMT